MKSKWKVTANPIGGQTLYAVCRILDTGAVDHSGNREFATKYMNSRLEAQRIADRLNEAEEEDTL